MFFSEYVEGSSFNKAVEIANFTGAAVDLTGYSLEIYFNGNTSPGATITLDGNTVADGDVFVIADDGSDGAILAEADLTPTTSFFNGDDAVVLRKDGDIVDVIGQIGTDPGSQWGSGDTSTQNNTIRRKSS
ncbi:MAG: lamin tail domain-containing protein, partial [Cyanobacteria bacterium P01_H01_bin.130]